MPAKKSKSLYLAIFVLGVFFWQTYATFAKFTDVPESYSQIKAIENLQLRNIVTGYPDGTFRPDKLITKGEFLKMVFTDLGYKPSPKLYPTPCTDIPAGSWLAPYVKKSLDMNLASCSAQSPLFDPQKALTRIQTVKIAFSLEGISAPYYTDIDPTDLFSDVNPGSPDAYLARAAKKYGIISSKSPDLFTPHRLMTRGDAAEMIYQLEQVRENPSGSVISAPNEENFTGIDDITAQFINNPKFPILLDVWGKVLTDFYNRPSINKDELVYGAIKGMVNTLGDQYTIFEEPSEALGLTQYLQGEFEGIGAIIDLVDKKLVIMKTLPDSPAEKANLKTGDVIQEIDNKPIDNLTINQILDMIHGTSGTTIHLTILRGNQTLELDLVRAKITISSVTGKIVSGNIGYIIISEFTSASDTEFDTVLKLLQTQSPKGYIIDLRDNPGGYLDAAVNILGHFVTEGKVVVSTKSADNVTDDYKSAGSGELSKLPAVVLINNNTASAAEILAGAIQDYKIGQLVGTKSFGKGSVQEIRNYPDNSLLKISIAHWLTPLNRDINEVGLTPDVTADLQQQDLFNGKDTQLDKAISIISSH